MDGPNERLLRRISLLLRDSLGAVPWPSSAALKGEKLPSLYRATASWSPAVSEGVSGLIYAAVFDGLPRLVHGSSEELFWLSVWGSCYFALAVAMARSASAEVLQIIHNRVLPLLSPEAVRAIDRDLKDR